ncbi:MAG: TrmH family RNA methyltransferase [Parcubacteria group bacterium]|nr:TrmH family RNA methyltransferase [Parcubacteria group bacterium]
MIKPADKQTYVVLHNIRSVHNVGSIFRTADAAGVEKIYLTGFTPAPIDRFGRQRKDFAKSALGAEKTVLWEQKEDILPLLNELKAQGFFILGVEQSPQAKDYKEIRAESPIAFVFGNEVSGLPPEVLSACDEIAEIPMHPHHSCRRASRVPPKAKQRHEWCGCVRGAKESLNVSVAAGIALFRILDI